VADILIRDVSEPTLRAVEERAREQDLSRNEFLRRLLDSLAPRPGASPAPRGFPLVPSPADHVVTPEMVTSAQEDDGGRYA